MKALILCGGKGERLKPLTNHIPKPMVQINKKPILEYVIDHILSFNIDEIILLTGYKGQLIKDQISDKYINKNIIFSNSGDVDIIKRINNVASFLDDDFLLFYGDTISDVNINALIKHHSMINSDMINSIYYTDIDADFECDTFFPEIPNNFENVFESKSFTENDINYNMKVYVKDGLESIDYINKATVALHFTKLTLGHT